MNIEELINKINSSAEELDFVSSRTFIEQNIDILERHKNLLNSNARQILNFVQERIKFGEVNLTREEMATVKAINSYASSFNLSGIKYTLKDNPKLFFKKDIFSFLNKDAVSILEGMGAIAKSKI
ncbi:hypothetical protein [Salirhabdus sp. Marseille-P4669]|uniref:hypothetical protein n=1 Tax=Salirhabdus sp. Marseille-P4669 TaxID=2042310 RepID=UPI000C7B703B|nr:hypothetical protein [Salirhabdus sp. Marseille-P4669]